MAAKIKPDCLVVPNVVGRSRLFSVDQGCFFIKGQTKNACDCVFNLLKLEYHRCNSWTFEQVVSHMNENEHITVDTIAKKLFLILKQL